MRRSAVRFRFWLITSLVVAFVASGWAFGIRLTPTLGEQPAFMDLGLQLSGADDDGRGR